VGGGASAFDLVDLCLEHGAAQVAWVYHSFRWMVSTRKPMVVGLDAPNLYFASLGLESTSAIPWQYAHFARTIVSQICGTAKLNNEPDFRHLNYFGVPTFLAEFDPASYPSDTWRNEHVSLVTDFPNERPIPRMPTWPARQCAWLDQM
jgi:hypothetical protein